MCHWVIGKSILCHLILFFHPLKRMTSKAHPATKTRNGFSLRFTWAPLDWDNHFGAWLLGPLSPMRRKKRMNRKALCLLEPRRAEQSSIWVSLWWEQGVSLSKKKRQRPLPTPRKGDLRWADNVGGCDGWSLQGKVKVFVTQPAGTGWNLQWSH
jgi:hypothetical protein